MSARQHEVTIKVTMREIVAVEDFLGECQLNDSVALTLGVLRQIIENAPKKETE